MPSIAMFVLALGLMYAYTALHPFKQVTVEAQKLARRVRLALFPAILLLAVSVGYQLPLEVSQGLARLSHNQAQQQAERFERRMIAERQHAAQMIGLFGGSEQYLEYLNATKAKKTPF